MEPNGVGTAVGQQNLGVTPTQNLSVAPAAQVQPPAQQATPQPQQVIAGTPYQVVNPQQPTQQVAPQPATQQAAPAGLQELRQQIAQATGYSLDQVPTDAATLSRIVLGGLGAQAELARVRQQQATQQPAPAAANGTQNPLQPVQMPPGWEGMVQKNAQGVYEPTHPAFSQVAQLANQNFAVQQMRQNAVQAGNLLPEHEQKIEQMVQQRLEAQLEQQRQQDFIAQHGTELFAHDANGNRQQTFDPQTGKMQPVMSEFGLAFNAAAEELTASGAQFPSQHRLAQLAYKMAKERTAQKAASQNGQGRTNGQPPAQATNPDLAALFTQHTANNTQRVGNVNGQQPITGNPAVDLRAALRNVFADMPAVAPGTEYARALGFNV